MAKQTKAEIKLNTDVYLNDSVPIRSIKPSYINEIITDLLDSYIHSDDVVDNLTSTLTEVPLSAHQGKILNDKILAMAGSLIPQGAWDASTNTPDVSGETQTGRFWIVSVDGATDIGGITDWKVNDWIVKTASGWAKVDNTDKVTSVNGEVGAVNLNGTYLPLTGGTLSGVLNADGGVVITKQGDGEEILKLNTERSWSFYQQGIGANSSLLLADNSGSKFFKIGRKIGNNEISSLFYTPAQGVYAKLQTWKGSDVNNTDVAYVDSDGVGSFNGGVVALDNDIIRKSSGGNTATLGITSLDFSFAGRNFFKASNVGGYFGWQVNGVGTNVMTLGANGQLTLTERLNAKGGITINQDRGFQSILIDNQLNFSNSGINYFVASSVGGYFVWQVNGVGTNVMTLGANGQLTLTEQLNADGGVVTPSVTNNGVKSKRYMFEAPSQTFSTINTTSYPLSNFGFSGDWKKLSVVSVVVFDNSETLNVDCASLGIEYQIDQYNVSLADVNLTKLNGLSTFTNHKVILIIEENI